VKSKPEKLLCQQLPTTAKQTIDIHEDVDIEDMCHQLPTTAKLTVDSHEDSDSDIENMFPAPDEGP